MIVKFVQDSYNSRIWHSCQGSNFYVRNKGYILDKLIIAKIKEMFNDVSIWQYSEGSTIHVNFFNKADNAYFSMLMMCEGFEILA